jgi:hypothetical protein
MRGNDIDYAGDRARLAAVLLGLCALAGCFTIDAKLEPTGAATMTIVMPYTGDPPLEMERKRITSPHVVVESAEADKGQSTMKLKIADVRKLTTSRLFENVTVTLDEKDGTANLVAKVVPDEVWRNIPDKGFDVLGKEVRISLEVPGTVTDTNAQERKPNAVTWKMPSPQFFRAKYTELKVSYKVDASGTTTPPTTAPPGGQAAPSGKS